MKLASISVVTVSLLVCAGAVFGCSSGRTRGSAVDTGVHAMDAGHVDTGIPARDTGPAHDTGGGGPTDTGGTVLHDTGSTTCSITCTSDSQCAAMCGAVPGGGTRCCDTSTSRCFVSHSTCPAPARDGGGGMSY